MFTWYVAGPMSNRPQFNVPSFLEAAEVLREKGYGVQLPADLDDPEIVAILLLSVDGKHSPELTGDSWGDCLAKDVKLIADVVDGVIVIDGWMRSKGARLETFVAFLCGKPVVRYPGLRKVRNRDLIKAWLGGLV